MKRNLTNYPESPEEFLDWLYGIHAGGSEKRPWHVLEWSKRLLDSQGEIFWRVVRKTWSGFDRIPHSEFQEQFARFRDSAEKVEFPADTEPKNGLLFIMRGQSLFSPLGLSWTTCEKTAESFAHGHRGVKNPLAGVWVHRVTEPDIAFTSNDREEHEIVLFEIPDPAKAMFTPLDWEEWEKQNP